MKTIKEKTSIPITEKDVVHSAWIQEIKDKVISPIEKGTLQYSLIGLWDLCGNIQDFVKEKQEEQTKAIKKMIEEDIDKSDDKICSCGSHKESHGLEWIRISTVKEILSKIEGGKK